MVTQLSISRPAEALGPALAEALRRAGAPAHRVEDRLREYADASGRDVRVHVLPAAILATAAGHTEVIDVAPGPPNIDRMCALEDLAERAATTQSRAADDLARVRALDGAPGRYGRKLTLIAFALASAAAAPFFGGGLVEIVAAGAVGLLSGGLALSMGTRPHTAHLLEVAAASGGAFLLHALAHRTPVAVEVALITGLIVLLPGFSLTTALTELATGHRVSGTAGLATGGMVLLELGFGTALGTRVAEMVLGSTNPSPAISAPAPGVAAIALLGVAVSFTVLLQARPNQFAQVLGACTLALYGQRAAELLLGPDLAGGAAAFAIALVANTMSRWLRQPAAVWQLPGILLLVPGSIGFRSITALLQSDVMAGVQGAFETALACMALVGGSLLGSALVPPRRSL